MRKFIVSVDGTELGIYATHKTQALCAALEIVKPVTEVYEYNVYEFIGYCPCGGCLEWDNRCGAEVCYDCGNHRKLSNCPCCHWSADGKRHQFDSTGEIIDVD